MHLNFCSRSHKIRESLSNWILWRQEGSLLIFFYSHIHNKFALAILGFQWLWVCYLCSYIWIDHFQQIAKFLFCADRFVLGLCNKHVLKSHPVGGRSLEWCYDQFGQFCCGWIWASSSSSSCLCVTSNSASIFSCHIHRLCTLLVTNTTQLNGAPLLAFVLVLLLIVFFPFSCIFPLVCCLRTLQAFLSPQEIWYTWPSRPSSIVSPIEQIHHDLFSFPLSVKLDPITCPRFSPLVCWQYPFLCNPLV